MPPKQSRPKTLPGTTYRMPTHCGKIYITVTGNRVVSFMIKSGRYDGCTVAGYAEPIAGTDRVGIAPATMWCRKKGRRIRCRQETDG